MTTNSRVRRSHILLGAVALLLLPPAAFAENPEPKATASIQSVVKTGDFIAVTRKSGGKVKGQVVEATECSILLRADGESLSIPNATVKTVRRYPPPRRNAGKAVLSAVNHCDRVECAPATLAYVGLAAVFKGFHELGRRPTVVYRAQTKNPPAACSK